MELLRHRLITRKRSPSHIDHKTFTDTRLRVFIFSTIQTTVYPFKCSLTLTYQER